MKSDFYFQLKEKLGLQQHAVLDVSNAGSCEEILNWLRDPAPVKVTKILTERKYNKNNTSGKLRLLNQCTKKSSLDNLQQSLELSYLKNLSFMPLEEQIETTALLNKAVENGDSYEFKHGNKLYDYFIVKDFFHEKTSKNLISWVWSSPDQTTEQKLIFREDMATILDWSGKNSLAAIHLENIASQKFFLKMGFKIKWLVVESL